MPRNTPTPEPAVPRETVAGWHARRGALLAKLHAQPQSQWAWLWRLHVDIADYLIHRYGGQGGGAGDAPPIDASAGPSVPEPGSPVTVDGAASEPGLPRLHGSARVARAASLEGPDAQRVRATHRDRLSSLHATNDARRASQPPIQPTPPYRPLFATLFLPQQATPDPRQPARRTSFPEDGWRPLDDDAEVEPLDDTSLALFRQAIADDQGWDLEAAEALTEDEVLRLLLGGDDSPQAEDTETS